MPVASLVPEVLGLAVNQPGTAGGPGGPGGGPPPAPDAGWELRVMAAPYYDQLLAVIPWRMVTGLQFARMENDTGSGTATLSMDDPFWKVGIPVVGSDPWSLDPLAGGSQSTFVCTVAQAALIQPGDTFVWASGDELLDEAGGVLLDEAGNPLLDEGGAYAGGTVFTVISFSPAGSDVLIGFSPPAPGAMVTGTITQVGSAAHQLLDSEHLWQVWQDGVLRHEFLGETITEQLDDSTETRIATVTGPGAIATLKWAMAAPPGFPDNIIYKLDAITDGFSEINAQGNPQLDTGLWNACQNVSDIALNPIGSAQLTATSGGTILGTTVFDATQTLISASMTPMVSPTASGATLDGSQLTQFYIQSVASSSLYALIGLSGSTFYCQIGNKSGVFTQVITDAAGYATAMSNNQAYQYWQISEVNGYFHFWTSPDGQNWTSQYAVNHDWDATQVGFYIAAKYDAGGQFATVSSINSNVTTSSLAGALYFNQPIMSIWLQQLAAARTRGTIPFVTTRATGQWDSYGNPWTDAQSVQIQNGTDLYSLLQGHASMINAQWVMDPGFTLKVGIPTAPGVITLGVDRSQQVVFYDSQGVMTRQRQRVRSSIANLIGAINTDGRTVTASDTSSITEWGQREAWIQAAVQVTQADMDVAAEASVESTADEVLSWTLQITPGLAGREVFTDFNVGDWIGLERPDFSAVDAVEVIGIAVSIDQDGAEVHELTLVSYLQYIEQQLKYIATKMGGGFVSSSGTTAVADNGQITNLNQPTVFAPTLSALGDVSSGAASGGNPLVYNPVTGQWLPAGQADPTTGNMVGLTVGQGGAGGSQAVISADGATVVVTGPNGAVVTTGVQADGTVTTTVANAPPPLAPDAPVVVGGPASIVVGWDGLLGGAVPLSDFLNVRIYVSTSSGFTPGTANLAQIITGAGVYTISSLPNGGGPLAVGTTYYVKLVACNQAGALSPASVQESAKAAGVTAGMIGGIGVLNQNPYFTGGDGTGWTGYDGTFSVSSTPPAGNGWPWAGFFTITTAGASPPAAAEESGQPFPVTPSTPYVATAWVNTPATHCVIGFDWLDVSKTYISTSTQSISVTASTWAQVTTVQTAPSNAIYAYIRIAPTDGNGNTIYFQDVYALPQVPGGLIEAGTITASQIAANTITAAQIAAGTITATQIQVGGITGTNIASGTITTSLIAAGAITGTLIAAGTITASNIAAGTIVAGIIDGTTVTGATIKTTSLAPGVEIDSSGNITVYNSHGGKAVQISPSAEAVSVYADTGSNTQGALIVAIGSTSTYTDPNTGTNIYEGITVYSSSTAFANLSGGILAFQAQSGQPQQASVTGVNTAGLLAMTSGEVTAGDAQAEVILASSDATGSGTQITLTADETILSGVATNPTLTIGSTTLSGTAFSLGNGSTANFTLNPKMATPSNEGVVTGGTATLAQLMSFCSDLYTSMKNRGMFN